MNIVIGADHRGYIYKEIIKNEVQQISGTVITWLDVGTHSTDRTDYPIYAQAASRSIQNGSASAGVLLCGTGVGMTIAANRFKGIYAGLAWNNLIARDAKEHDGVNLLVLPADFLTEQQIIDMIIVWLSTAFKKGRYEERLIMIDQEQQ